MTEWIDVPVAEVAVGDEAKVDGYGKLSDSAYSFQGIEFYPVVCVDDPDLVVDWMQGRGGSKLVHVRRSSIVAVRRRKPEPQPQPKPGDWRCEDGVPCRACRVPCRPCRVYRASGGWSPDTRTGKSWVMKAGETVTRTDVYTVRLVRQLSNGIWEYDQPHDGSFKYEPVDRRKK